MAQDKAELGMYPFAGVRWAWDALWQAVTDRLDWLPPKLAHSGDVHGAWGDESVVVNQVCGWPFAAYHQETMTPIGAFAIALPSVFGPPDAAAETTSREPGYYRSVLVSRHDRRLDELVDDAVIVAINSADSLSGSHSLTAATVGTGERWPGPVVTTDAHVESLRALLSGRADLAAIDSWTLALAVGEEPGLIDGLYRVGYGPVIPTPVVTVRTHLGPERIVAVHDAFTDALDAPETQDARTALFITGWVDHDADVYRRTEAVAPFPASP